MIHSPKNLVIWKQLQRNIILYTLIQNKIRVGSIMGPLFGSYLYASMGWAIPLYGQGVLFFLSSMLTFFYIPNDS